MPAQAPAPDPAHEFIALEAGQRAARLRAEHESLLLRLQAVVGLSKGTAVEQAAQARLAEVTLEADLLRRLRPLSELQGKDVAALLPSLARLDLRAPEWLALAGLATLAGERTVAENALAQARDLDAGTKDATDRSLAALRSEPVPAGGYHRYRGEWLALAARDAARALDDALDRLSAVAAPAGLSLPFPVRHDQSNRTAFAALGAQGPAALRAAATTVRAALEKRYAMPRAFYASYANPSARAALLDADQRSRERAQAARDRIRTYDKPAQGEVDALRADATSLATALDAARERDRSGYAAVAPGDAERVRQEVTALEEALRAVGAFLDLAAPPGLDRVEIAPPKDAATSRVRVLPGRTQSGLEDCLWLALHRRAGLLNVTIAHADELLRHADRLTAWERLIVEDLRDDAVREYVRDVAATSLDDKERAFVEALNAYRAVLRLRSLEPDERLVRAARKHSEEMVRLGYFGHVSPIAARRTPSDRARLEGFAGGAGENCLAGTVDGEGAFEGWYRSPGHHRNLIAAGPSLGIGATADHAMWTMLIGGGDADWRVAHRDATRSQRAEAATMVTRLVASAKQARKTAPPPATGDHLLPALLRAALPACYEGNVAGRNAAAELLRVAAAQPALPEQRVLLDVAAHTAKERLELDLALPAAPAAKVEAKTELATVLRGDGPSLRAPLKLVTKSERQRLAKQYGGGPRTERLVERGLAFLARCQDVDGAWRARSFADVVPGLATRNDAGRGEAEWELAMTGLSLLCFLTTGSSPQQGEHATQVDRGVRFLMSKLLDYGRFETGASHYMYNHALATQALCEAYAYTADPVIGVYAQLAVDWIVDAQNRQTGGWRYEPQERGDTSVVGWVVMALNSAHKAQLDVAGFRDAARFLDAVTEKQYYRVGYEHAADDGIFRNRLGAVAMTSRRFLGGDPGDPRLYWPAARMLDDLPSAQQADYYYWYYGTLALFLAGGDAWQQWSEALTSALVALHVEKEGQPIDGAFEPDRHYSRTGGRIYSTALAILCATAWYRYDRAPRPKLTPFTGDIDKACAPYVALLLDPPDDRTLRIASAKLADAFGPYAVPVILRALALRPPAAAARRLAAVIEQVAEPMNESALLANLGVSDDDEVRKTVFRALERACSARSIQALLAAMRSDKNAHVRGQAARALGALAAGEAVAELSRQLPIETDAFAKEQIQNALRRIGSQDAIDKLIAAATPDGAGRPALRSALAVLERDQVADRIAALEAKEPKLYKRVLETIGKERTAAAIPVLIILLDCDAQAMREVALGLLRALTRHDHGFDVKHDQKERAESIRRWLAWWAAQGHGFGAKKKK